MKTILIVILMIIGKNTILSYPPTCDNDIYCHGDILHTVQNAYIFEDSKTFVDMHMKMKPNEVKEKFKEMMNEHKNKPPKAAVKKFVNECFDPPGSEFETFQPKDWRAKPKMLNSIEDKRLKDWANYLNRLWKQLGRKMKNEVKKEQDQYSIIYVPNPVIVPGGRFREFYYWDSYWIILGLLHSEMVLTVKGMLENFMMIINDHGLIPNGGRIYYIRRSQPPLMIPMVKLYYDHTKDKEFIVKYIDTLAKEFKFWMDKRCVEFTVDKRKIKLAHYAVETKGPRPESYREDVETAQTVKNEKDKEEFYAEIKSACESGWDFSSRWFINTDSKIGNLSDIKTRNIIPVDLNAVLCWNAELLGQFYELIGHTENAKKYSDIAKQWKESINNVLWNNNDGIWYDYDFKTNKQRKFYYATNFAPLWTGCFDKDDHHYISSMITSYVNKMNLMQYNGGLPTSLEISGEQWDLPNAWPPLQHMVIQGLENLNTRESKKIAYDMAFIWIRANFKGYLMSSGMFEKYDSQIQGAYGGGGEYDVQLGFGWTNGVCLDLLRKYGSKLDSRGINGADRKHQFPTELLILILWLLWFKKI